MCKNKKDIFPWTKVVARLKRQAKTNGWPLVHYYDCGYRVGYLKTKGPKWAHIVIIAWKEGKHRTKTRRLPIKEVKV